MKGFKKPLPQGDRIKIHWSKGCLLPLLPQQLKW